MKTENYIEQEPRTKSLLYPASFKKMVNGSDRNPVTPNDFKWLFDMLSFESQ